MKKTFYKSIKTLCKSTIAAGVLLTSSTSQAVPLDLSLFESPDISSSFITVEYDAGLDTLTANGFSIRLNDDNIAPSLEILNNAKDLGSTGTFSLTAIIDDAGVFTSGTFEIGGKIDDPAFSAESGTILAGTLTDFGFNPVNEVLEFLFTVTGGDAASLYLDTSDLGGIILDQTGYEGSFTENFTNVNSLGVANGVADVAAVPVPAAIWLFGSGLVGLIGLGQRRRLA